jgi:hypothetical protein
MPNVAEPFAARDRVARDRLIDALSSERRLVDDLIALMRRQRVAVAADDLPSLEETVYAVQRVLCTLGEARKRRRALNVRLCQFEGLRLTDLEEALGSWFTPRVREMREALQDAARTLSGEVALNRRVLREALATNDS